MISKLLSDIALKKLSLIKTDDKAAAHFQADQIMTELLQELGYYDVVHKYRSILMVTG